MYDPNPDDSQRQWVVRAAATDPNPVSVGYTRVQALGHLTRLPMKRAGLLNWREW
jgi:hypothetical protein